MARGWFSVDRKLVESDLWLAEKFTRGQAWVDIIGLARFESSAIRLKGTRVNLTRGQLAWSEVGMAKRWQWSRGKVRRFLGELETDQRIVQQKTNLTSVITVVNYGKYQSCSTARKAESDTASRTADDTRNNKGNNLTIKTTSPAPARGKQGPPVGLEEVERVLERCGVSAVADAIQGAQARGATPPDILSLIGEFNAKPGAWGPGALFKVIVGELAAWPEPSEEYRRDQQRKADRHRQEQLSNRAERKQVERAESDLREAELRARFDDKLNSMDQEEIIGLIREAEPGNPEFLICRYRKRGLTDSLRQLLLGQLDTADREAGV